MQDFEIRDLMADAASNAGLDIITKDGWADTMQVVVTDGAKVWYLAVTEAHPFDAAIMINDAGQAGR